MSSLVEKLQKALEHQKKGEMEPAEKIYRSVLKSQPQNLEILQMAAIFFNQIGNDHYAWTLLKKLINKKPSDCNVRRLAGQVLWALKDYNAAQDHLKKALALNPLDPQANLYMGLSYMATAQPLPAEPFLKKSLEVSPCVFTGNKLAEALLNMARAQDAKKILEPAYENGEFNYDTLLLLAYACGLETKESLAYLTQAIQLAPDRDEAKGLFSHVLLQDMVLNRVDPALWNVVLSCLQSKNVNYNGIKYLWYHQFFENPEYAKAAELLDVKTYEDFKILYEQPGYKETLLNPFFIEGVKKVIPFNVRFESLLTFLRRYYLEKTVEKTAFEEAEGVFVAALATQCFLNEYVFDETPQETEKLAALSVKTQEQIMLYACYRPLIDHPEAQNLIRQKDGVPPHIQETLQTQVIDVLTEQKLKTKIPAVGSIKNEISKAVRAQYEEHPYPRWQSDNNIRPFIKTIDEVYQPKPDILIAGCGTGKNIFNARVRYPFGKITAVDLSLASMAYAKRKVEEYGLKDIKFLQADILDLGQLNKKFDIIECMGVLHHMEKPEDGLKVLVEMLKPGGQIDLGLYSEYGRREIVQAHKIIAEKGFKSDTKGMRACRSFIKQTKEFNYLMISSDFFSTSTCRDLIFHVREVRYTIPRIKEMLEAVGLKFIKFRLPEHRMNLYRQAFPEDEAADNLENWDKFEQEHPQIFSSMYQFRCQKI